MKKVAILGAGLTGLSVAWFLKKKFAECIQITVYEKSERVGGYISTRTIGDFLFEEGPRGFRPSGKGAHTLELIKDLKLEKELVSANEAASKRYIYLQGKLQCVNFSFLLKNGFIRALLKDLTTPCLEAEDETVDAFTKRRFNSRLADHLIDPLMKGICGGDSKHLSVRSCLPFLWEAEQKSGSVLKGFLSQRSKKHPTPLFTFKKGMETLPKTLMCHLDCQLVLRKEVINLNDLKEDFIVSTLPTSALSPLVSTEDPLTYQPLLLVNLGWKGKVLKKSGFGFLVPTKENSNLLGMTWDSEIFPELNFGEQTRLCVMLSKKVEQDPYTAACLHVEKLLGIKHPPNAYAISKGSIPQYNLLHHRKIVSLRKALPSHVYALGMCFEGLGVNDCIFQAKKWVETLADSKPGLCEKPLVEHENGRQSF